MKTQDRHKATPKRVSKRREAEKPKAKEEDEESGEAGRSLWTGSLSFGLVNIPVRLISALQTNRISFHMLHDKDMTRLQRRMINPKTGKVVTPEEQERGFALDKEQYIVITEEELAAIDPKRSQAIEITDFVDFDDVDPLYISTFYYLQPANIAKPYNLLVEAMEKNKKAAIAKVALHSHEYLVMIRPYKGILCLFVLHYQEEVVTPAELKVDSKPEEKQLKNMSELIKEMSGKLSVKELIDENRLALAELIKEKIAKNKDLAKKAPKSIKKETTPRADLIAALEQSLSKIKNQKK